MPNDPVDEIGGLASAANVSKADFRAYEKARNVGVFASADEVRSYDLSGRSIIWLGSSFFKKDTESTAVDDEFSVIIDGAGNRWIKNSGSTASPVVSLIDFGGSPTASADVNDAAIAAAEGGTADNIFVPEGRFETNLTMYQAGGKVYRGLGQLVMSGYGQARERTFITTEQPAPDFLTHAAYFDTGFKKSFRTVYSLITDGANPSSPHPTNYRSFDEWSQDVHRVEYYGGFNVSTSTNEGRSGFGTQTFHLLHGGQGDAAHRIHKGHIFSSRIGATHFLANPAIQYHGGSFATTDGTKIVGDTTDGSKTISNPTWISPPTVGAPVYGAGVPVGAVVETVSTGPNALTISIGATATAAGVTIMAGGGWGCFLQGYEFNFHDTADTPAAVIHRVNNYHRHNNSKADLGLVWIHDRPQAVGPYASDCAYSVGGMWNNGLDFTPTSLGPGKPAINLKAGDRIYFNASATADSVGAKFFADNHGGEWVEGQSGALLFAVSGAAYPFIISATANAVNGVQVVGAVSGSSPVISAQGTDTNVSLRLMTRGTGLVSFTNATGSWNATVPAVTDTLIGKATADTLTNKTFDTAGAGNSLLINSVTANANSGTGAIARAASPAFTGNATFENVTTSGSVASVSATAFSPQNYVWNQTNDANAAYMQFRKSRGASGAGSAVQVSDFLGTFLFRGADSNGAMQNAAYIGAVVTAVGSGSVAAKLQLTAGTAIVEIDTTGNLSIPAAAGFRVNSLKVIGARKTGWATATGTATRTTFDTATVTVSQLAERFKALLDDIHASGGGPHALLAA